MEERLQRASPPEEKRQITMDKLGEHFSALLGPLGEILTHMQEQNEHSVKQLKHSAEISGGLESNNKRLLLLLVFVGLCSIITTYQLIQSHLLALKLNDTNSALAEVRSDLRGVRTIANESRISIQDTEKAVNAVSPRVTLESRDGGVSVVVRPSIRSRKVPGAGRPMVVFPVTVPSSLKVEEEPKDREPRTPKRRE